MVDQMDQLEQQAQEWIKGVLERLERGEESAKRGLIIHPRGMDENLLEEPLRTRVKQILDRQGWRV